MDQFPRVRSQSERRVLESLEVDHKDPIDYKDVTPSLLSPLEYAAISRKPRPSGAVFYAQIIEDGVPCYWWRQLALDPDKVVWMKCTAVYERVINITSRKAWEQVMEFRREFLAERNQPDYHKELGLDVLLGPFERPQRRTEREYRRIIKAPVVDSNAHKKYATKIPSAISGTKRKYEHWRVRSDRNLWRWLRKARNVPQYRHGVRLVLEVTALKFLYPSISRKDARFEEIMSRRCPPSWFGDEQPAVIDHWYRWGKAIRYDRPLRSHWRSSSRSSSTSDPSIASQPEYLHHSCNSLARIAANDAWWLD